MFLAEKIKEAALDHFREKVDSAYQRRKAAEEVADLLFGIEMHPTAQVLSVPVNEHGYWDIAVPESKDAFELASQILEAVSDDPEVFFEKTAEARNADKPTMVLRLRKLNGKIGFLHIHVGVEMKNCKVVPVKQTYTSYEIVCEL